jgi:Amt family ammonium transporter
MHKKTAIRPNRGQIEHSLSRTLTGALGALAAGLAPAAAFAADGAADTGSTAWVLSATALVLFMTLPGLALFYGGLVRARNVLSVLMHCVTIACVASLLWAVAGYSLAFGEGTVLGGLGNLFLAGLAPVRAGTVLPEAAFVAFQMTFAIITPALVIGAFPERVTFPFVIGFAALWLLLVYVPAAHWVWGGGFLAGLGVLDFAGGIVVHTTAGVSALVAALLVGPRRGFPRSLVPPHSPGMTMAGAGMLWVGWFGFNGGSALAADAVAANAILVTHLAAATAAIVWTAVEWIKIGKPTSVGIVTGVIAGLATITPASGYVGPAGAIAIGAAAGALCFAAVLVVKQRFLVDDSLDVFAVHGVGGMLGSLLLALFASTALGGAGLAEGRSWAGQLGIQAVGVLVVAVWSAAATFAILKLLDAMVGLRVGAEEEHDGLDLSAHGERAYDFT